MHLIAKLRERGFVPFMVGGAAIFLIVWVVRGERHLFNLFGPHEYWASLWASDYRHGFVNRGLLGETLRRLSIDNTNYKVLTLASWAVSLGLFGVILNTLWRLLKDFDSRLRAGLLVAITLSPAIAGMLIETMGDPLMLLLLVHVLLAPLLLGRRQRWLVVGVIYALVGSAMELVHEASVFFFVPWLGVQAFLAQRTPAARAAFIGYTLASLSVVTILVVRGFSVGGGAAPVLHMSGQTYTEQGGLAPPFAELLHVELQRMFGHGLSGLLTTACRLIGAAIIPLCLAALLTAARTRTAAVALWRNHAIAFLAPAICLGPLMLIASDWGRFFSYQFILFLVTLAAMRPSTPQEASPNMDWLNLPLFGALVLSGITTTSALRDYRMDGLFANAGIFVACLLLIGFFAIMTRLSAQKRTG